MERLGKHVSFVLYGVTSILTGGCCSNQHFILRLFIQGVHQFVCHTAVLLRDIEKVCAASNFPHKSFSLWLVLPSPFGMGMWSWGITLQESHFYFAEKVNHEQKLYESETTTVHSFIKCFVYFSACSQHVLLFSLFDQQQAWIQLAFAEVCFLWSHRSICISNYSMDWVSGMFPLAFFLWFKVKSLQYVCTY